MSNFKKQLKEHMQESVKKAQRAFRKKFKSKKELSDYMRSLANKRHANPDSKK